MEAKNTMMTDEQMKSIGLTPTSPKRLLARKQAEISFKAGLKEAVDIIEEGRTWCTLNDKAQCSQCLDKLITELNAIQS